MTSEEAEVVEAAQAPIAGRGVGGRVAAVVLTGGQHVGLNPECRLPRATICAEAAALGQAVLADPAAEIPFCAAVGRDGAVLPPRGACREPVADFAPCARIAVPDGTGAARAVRLSELLPHACRTAERGLS